MLGLLSLLFRLCLVSLEYIKKIQKKKKLRVSLHSFLFNSYISVSCQLVNPFHSSLLVWDQLSLCSTHTYSFAHSSLRHLTLSCSCLCSVYFLFGCLEFVFEKLSFCRNLRFDSSNIVLILILGNL